MNVYEVVTERILADMEKGGIAPWNKPWRTGEGEGPTNLVSHKEYRGVNRFLLGVQGYERPYFVTYNQAQALGGQVSRGAKGSPVIFWKTGIRETENPDTHEIETDKSFLLRYYTVFNVSQCEGLEGKLPALPTTEVEPVPMIERCEAMVAAWANKPTLSHWGDRAMYQPGRDKVTMPERNKFENPEYYYSTLFHELSHATGHESRLNRKGITDIAPFGSACYSREELVAEMGAAFLSGEMAIDNAAVALNTVSYLEGWRKVLRADSKAIVMAAAQAQKAADMILGRIGRSLNT